MRATAKYGTLESDEHIVSRRSIHTDTFLNSQRLTDSAVRGQPAISATVERAVIEGYQNSIKATAEGTKVRAATVGIMCPYNVV